MSCTSPLDVAVLADYWLGLLSPAEEESIEEHFFSCNDCAGKCAETITLAEELRKLAHSGSLRVIVSETFLERAAAEGMQVRQYAPPLGGSVECTVTLEDDLLIGRLAADLSNFKRVDLALCDSTGAEQFRMADVPFSPDAVAVLFQQSITFAKAAPDDVMIARMLAVDETGSERAVGEYRFNHTRTIPGPPGW